MSVELLKLIQRRKNHEVEGIYSVCSAHPWVIEAALQQAASDKRTVLIEATSNQVNKFGGYTGLRPAEFRNSVLEIAKRIGLDGGSILFGGDHLGPNPWQHLSAEEAMRHAVAMVEEYVEAGFSKIHLDTSMACADETGPLPDSVVAARAARLCRASEATACRVSHPTKPVYVIGTEVPVPGGSVEALDTLAVTRREAAEKTILVHREAFQFAQLESVWSRVIALVVQPGVEFDHDRVVDYDPEKARDLCSLLQCEQDLVFEAHSTDYQRPEAYRALVQDGFAILKVGPALTFAMREAIYALADIEQQLIPQSQQSCLLEIVEQTMLARPEYWQRYYHGNSQAQKILRVYSYSDRIRYYWGDPAIQKSVEILIENLNEIAIPETLISRYFPVQYREVRAGNLVAEPLALVFNAIRETLRSYAQACCRAAATTIA